MDLDTIIRTRRSCRHFKTTSVSKEKIAKIIEAGIWAPSSGGSAPWKFKIVDDPNSIRDLYSLIADVNYETKRHLQPEKLETELRDGFESYIAGIRAATIHIICYYDEQHMIDLYHEGDVANYQEDRIYAPSYANAIDLAIENMMLKITELGLGSLYFVTGVFVPKKINKLFDLRDSLIPITILPIGVPDSVGKGDPRLVQDFLL